ADATSGVDGDVACTPASGSVFGVGTTTVKCSAKDKAGNTASAGFDVTVRLVAPSAGTVGGSVPATLALTLGAPASFGPFPAGVAKEYTATTTASVISTAGDATLSVADNGANPGHLVNGAFVLPQSLQGLGVIKTYSAPVSNDQVTVTFKQAIA